MSIISAWANRVFLFFWEHSFRFLRFHFTGPQEMRNGVFPAISVNQDDIVIRVSSHTGNPLQYSCLENPRDGGAWWAAVHGVARSRTRLSDVTFTFHIHALEMEWQPTSVFLPGESQGRGSLVGCCLWGHTELDMTKATLHGAQEGGIYPWSDSYHIAATP